MNHIKLTKRHELLGIDERDLDRRIATLRRALRYRGGRILECKREYHNAVESCAATVFYEIPLSGANLELHDGSLQGLEDPPS